VAISDFKHEFAEVLQIGAVSHAEGDAKADARIFVAPIGDALSDEISVWDDDGNVVIGDHGGAAQADLADLSGYATDFDSVADGNGPLGENNEAADEVADDILQAEPEANADSAGEHCE
jgi:hypothetical protein